MIRDLDELVLSCRSSAAKDYIQEAVKCYRAGAYKACITSTWVALVYDIIDKIKELSFANDNQAEMILNTFKTYKAQIEDGSSQGVKSGLEFERQILSDAKDKLEFIDKSQYDDLIRLREDRHKCAHPSFRKDDSPYNPSAELARLHMRNAVEYVLSQPPVQGKAALNYLANIINSEYFPTDGGKILEELQNSPLANSTEALKTMFIDKLFFDIFDPGLFANKSKAHKVEIINTCYDMFPDLVVSRIIHQINSKYTKVKDEQFYHFPWMIARLKFNIWNKLDNILKERIKKFITDGDKVQVLTTLPELQKINDLKAIINYRYIPSLSVENLIEAFNKGRPALKQYLYPLVVDKYIDNHESFIRTNQIARTMLIPYDYLMNDDSIRKILNLYSEHPYIIRDSTSLGNVVLSLYTRSASLGSEVSKEEIDNVLHSMDKDNLIISQEHYNELIEDIPF